MLNDSNVTFLLHKCSTNSTENYEHSQWRVIKKSSLKFEHLTLINLPFYGDSKSVYVADFQLLFSAGKSLKRGHFTRSRYGPAASRQAIAIRAARDPNLPFIRPIRVTASEMSSSF